MFLVKSKQDDSDIILTVYAVELQKDEHLMTPPKLMFLVYWKNEWSWTEAKYYEPLVFGPSKIL